MSKWVYVHGKKIWYEFNSSLNVHVWCLYNKMLCYIKVDNNQSLLTLIFEQNFRRHVKKYYLQIRGPQPRSVDLSSEQLVSLYFITNLQLFSGESSENFWNAKTATESDILLTPCWPFTVRTNLRCSLECRERLPKNSSRKLSAWHTRMTSLFWHPKQCQQADKRYNFNYTICI